MGECYTVEYAVRADGSEPAKQFLDLLKEGMWKDDPEADDFPHDEQISDRVKFLDKMKYLACYGEPQRRNDINVLRDGLWEFKVATKRLVFYDTGGNGTYDPKRMIADRDESPAPDSDLWMIPTFDRYLRLANCWPKIGQTADPVDIDEGRTIREEDLAHDREQ